MKVGDIVVYKEKIGHVVTSDGKFKFFPCNQGHCQFRFLDTITETDIREATHEEKLELLTEAFNLGRVVRFHCIGEYQVAEYVDNQNQTSWYGYVDYHPTNEISSTLDAALICCIGYKHEGVNNRSARYICRMLGIKEE